MAKPASSKKPLALVEPAKKKVETERRVYLSQADVPAYTLAQAMRIPEAIFDNYAGKPTPPLRVASAISLQPQSSTFRQICGAAIAYGLTTGGYNSEAIGVSPLAKRVFRPLHEGDDLAAKREAFLKPRIIGEFLGKYDGSKFPRDEIAKNLLEDMGVPRDRTTGVLEILTEGASTLGLIETIKGTAYVHLAGVSSEGAPAAPAAGDAGAPGDDVEEDGDNSVDAAEAEADQPANGGVDRSRVMRRVYITHGKNRTFLDLLKKFLTLTELEPVLSVERESVAVPVPEKVMRDMRSCGAALIHVDEEQQLVGTDATVHNVLNANVLIEIGAAMALYGKRFILLVKDGVKLPSNLQGIYELRYMGDALDAATTVRLLEAIAALKNEPLPSVWIEDA